MWHMQTSLLHCINIVLLSRPEMSSHAHLCFRQLQLVRGSASLGRAEVPVLAEGLLQTRDLIRAELGSDASLWSAFSFTLIALGGRGVATAVWGERDDMLDPSQILNTTVRRSHLLGEDGAVVSGDARGASLTASGARGSNVTHFSCSRSWAWKLWDNHSTENFLSMVFPDN